jgi:hypothetical protein
LHHSGRNPIEGDFPGEATPDGAKKATDPRHPTPLAGRQLSPPIYRRRGGILWEIDIERRRKPEQFAGACVLQHLRVVHGRDRNVFAVLWVVPIFPIYPFVKLKEIELSAFAALQQISEQVALVCVRIDQLEEILYPKKST